MANGKNDIAKVNPYEGYDGLVYVRVSDKKQEKEGHGRESQEERCKNELASMKVPHDRSFIDTYTGGGDFMHRPAMGELLAYIDAHPHQKFVVVFDDLKRFARDVEFHLKLRAAFKFRDVILRCLNYKFDESPEGQFVEVILAAQGELERKQNARQVIQKMKSRLEMGFWCFSGKKGYTSYIDPIYGKVFKPNDEGSILAEALEGFSKRTFPRKIDACRFLVERSFWTGQSPEKYIDNFTAMLKDPFYAGDIEYLPWDVSRRKGHHQGIISLETFECNQRILKKENILVRIRQDISPDFPIRGLLVCHHCGGHITAAYSKKTFAYYLCNGNKQCERYGKSIQKEIIEKQFLVLLQSISLKDEIGKLVEVVFERVWKQEIHYLEALQASKAKETKQLEERAVQLTNLLIGAKSPQTKSVFERQLNDVAVKLEELGGQSVANMDLNIPYRTALSKAVGLLKHPYDIWQTMNVFEQHRLFFFIFEEKLPYNQKLGYRTDEISSISSLFEEFLDENSQRVPPVGIEPTLEG